MARKALFTGLVSDTFGRPVEVTVIGGESFYVVDDDGFQRHIESEVVDRQVLERFAELVRGNEDLISESTMQAIGQDDIFTRAVIERSLENMEDQFEQLLESGLPDEVRTWMGMQGFAVRIDERGAVTHIEQPGAEP